MKNFKILIYCLLIGTIRNEYFSLELRDEPNEIERENFECELLNGECTDQNYKYTTSLTKLNDGSIFFGSQKVADETIRSFKSVMPCSNYLKLFLCGTYKPSCHEEANLIIQPCKSMCEHVFKRCYPIMSKLRMKWSTELNCSRFLEDSSESCMKDTGYLKDYPLVIDSNEYENLFDRLVNKTTRKQSQRKNSRPRTSTTTSTFRKQEFKLFEAHYNQYVCFNDQNKTLKQCSLKCNANVLFTFNEKLITKRFTLTLSVMCLVSCCLSFFIYFVSSIKYVYPKIVFVYMAICYAMHSVIHLGGLSIGRDLVSCHRLTLNSETQYIYSSQESDNNYCFVTLILIYYFRMTALSWWLYLVLTWFLIVCFKVNLKVISRFSAHYSHYIVWLLSALKLVFPIVFTQPGTMSELSGLCSIGDLDKNSLFYYLILPSVIYLSLGILALITGFTKIILNREKAKKKFQSNKHLVKAGFICLGFSLAYIAIVCCELYEFYFMESWPQLPKYFDLNTNIIEHEAFDSKIKILTGNSQKKTVITPIFITKIFMQFVNAFFILFLVSINSKRNKSNNSGGICAHFTQKTSFNEIYSSNTSDNPEHSYQFYPQQPPQAPSLNLPTTKLQTRCDCAYKHGQPHKQNDFSEHHHYCTPHALFVQSDMRNYGCDCTTSHHAEDTPKLSTFLPSENIY